MAYDPLYYREQYEWYKSHGICVQCHKTDATHGVLCEECAFKNKKRIMIKRKLEYEKIKRANKKTL